MLNCQSRHRQEVMKVTIIGGGVIGTALGNAWSRAGHDVQFGLRGEGRTSPIPGAKTSNIREALIVGEVIVLAIPSETVPAFCDEYSSLLRGRIVVDPTITFGGAAMNRFDALSKIPVRYIRAFCTQGPEVYRAPMIDGMVPDQFYTAADEESRTKIATLIKDVGLRPVYIGESDQRHVSVIDGVTRLWFSLAIQRGLGRHLSFRLLSDADPSVTSIH